VSFFVFCGVSGSSSCIFDSSLSRNSVKRLNTSLGLASNLSSLKDSPPLSVPMRLLMSAISTSILVKALSMESVVIK